VGKEQYGCNLDSGGLGYSSRSSIGQPKYALLAQSDPLSNKQSIILKSPGDNSQKNIRPAKKQKEVFGITSVVCHFTFFRLYKREQA